MMNHGKECDLDEMVELIKLKVKNRKRIFISDAIFLLQKIAELDYEAEYFADQLNWKREE